MWNKIKLGIKELVKMYSDKPSFFSKKRVESGIAFVIAQWGMIHWLILNVRTIDVYAISLWAAIEFSICGYVINKIEEHKKDGQ